MSANSNHPKTRGMQHLSSGWASWRWLSGISAKEKEWFLGSLRGRSGYQSWIAHLARGLQDPDFLLKFEATVDPWDRSRIVGRRISELRKTYRTLSEEQRLELAREGEVELKAGLEMMGKD